MDIKASSRVLLRIMNEEKTDVLRLPKKHASKVRENPTPADARRLIESQSLRDAIAAGLVVIVLFSIFWAMLSSLANRIFPWMTLLLGILVGLAVRRAGRGLDWRFPVVAAVLAVAGSLAGNVVVAAAFTAPVLETSTLNVLRSLTAMTWPVFFAEVLTPADTVFALFAAAIAAFYANRRLTRTEVLALRNWHKHGNGSDAE
jgi:hypothetical protein